MQNRRYPQNNKSHTHTRRRPIPARPGEIQQMLIRQESLTAKMSLKDLPSASPLPTANLVMVFGSVKRFSDSKLAGFLKSRYPTAQIIGCTTSGEINLGGVLVDSLQIT